MKAEPTIDPRGFEASRPRRIGRQAALAACLAACLFSCSGPKLATAASEPGCPRCSVLAESDTPFVELQAHDDTLFVLDTSGAISATPKAGGELVGVVAAGSGAVHFGVSASSLAWVAPSAPSGSQTNQVHALGRDGSARPQFEDFQGAAALGVGFDDAFVAAFSGNMVGSQILRYALADGSTSSPAETLSDEEQSELALVAGGDAELVWCRTHLDHSSSLWRLGATGEAAKSDYAFACAALWTTGDGQVFVLDSSPAMNCYYRIDVAGQSQMLTCTSADYEQLSALADGSIAVIEGGSAVRRIGSDGQVSLLFSAASLIGIQSSASKIYYATATHVGSFSLTTAL